MKPQNSNTISFNPSHKKNFSPETQELLAAIELSQAADDSLWKELAVALLDDMKKISMIDSKTLQSKIRTQKRDDDMKYEEEFELYKLISQMADEYPELDVLLKSHDLTYEKALQKANDWKNEFECLLEKLNIHAESLDSICGDVIKRIPLEPDDPDLQRIYCMLITDLGLLFSYDERTEEQDIRNYLKQSANTKELLEAIAEQKKMRLKLENLLNAVKMKMYGFKDVTEEANSIFQISMQYDLLSQEQDNTIYEDNVTALLQQIEANPYLREVKPYLIAYVLSHRSGYMLTRENYQPNLESALRYTEYNIHEDNGKNFKSYQQSIELYMALRSYYQSHETVDIAFSDYCFANLSNLSDWFYENFEPDAAVPIKLAYKAALLKTPMFPMLPEDTDVDAEKLEEDMFFIINNWI